MSESAASTVGARLKAIRGLVNQKEFAEKLEVALSSYQNYERDDRQLPSDAFLKLYELGWNINWILTGEGPERLDALSGAVSDPSQALRPDTLKMAVTLAQEALDGKSLNPEDYSALVTLIYDALANGLKSAQVLAFAKPAARGLGAKDGREAVGRAGKETPGKG